MAKVVHKINKNYTGLGNYEIRISLNVNNGKFSTYVPRKFINAGNLKLQTKETILTDTQYLYSIDFNDLLKQIEIEYNRFENFNIDYDRIILLTIEEKRSHMDGSGRGIVFNWGVFRKYKNPRNEYLTYELETSNPNVKQINYQNLKNWKHLKYSQETIDFLIKIDNNLDTLIANLVNLINSDNIEQHILTLNQ